MSERDDRTRRNRERHHEEARRQVPRLRRRRLLPAGLPAPVPPAGPLLPAAGPDLLQRQVGLPLILSDAPATEPGGFGS